MRAVHAWDVPNYWDAALPKLQYAIDRGREHTPESVFHALCNGQMVLWLHKDAYIVTSWCDFPRGRIGYVMFAGGRRAKEWAHEAEETLTRWAKAIGCKELRLSGRKGWKRYFGALEETIMLSKVIT